MRLKIDCCQTAENGFPCQCINSDFCHSQEAEDDGYADWKYDQQRQERDERGQQ